MERELQEIKRLLLRLGSAYERSTLCLDEISREIKAMHEIMQRQERRVENDEKM